MTADESGTTCYQNSHTLSYPPHTGQYHLFTAATARSLIYQIRMRLFLRFLQYQITVILLFPQ